jgi:hypothetical protein
MRFRNIGRFQAGSVSSFLHAAVLALAGGALLSLYGSPQAGFAGRATAQPGIPLELRGVTAETNIVTRELFLNYTLTNQGTDHLIGVGLQVVLLDERGRPRGGESLSEALNLPPGRTQSRRLRLSNLHYFDSLSAFRVAVIGIVSWRSEWAQWALALPAGDVARAMARGETLQPRYSQVQASDEGSGSACNTSTWCPDCQNSAITVCGEGNIARFSCSVGTSSCPCTYACKDADPPQDPPETRKLRQLVPGVEVAGAVLADPSAAAGCAVSIRQERIALVRPGMGAGKGLASSKPTSPHPPATGAGS